jgi:hypothetical protein
MSGRCTLKVADEVARGPASGAGRVLPLVIGPGSANSSRSPSREQGHSNVGSTQLTDLPLTIMFGRSSASADIGAGLVLRQQCG